MRRLGLVLVAAGVLLWLATSAVSPYPTSPFTLDEKVRAAGRFDASRVLLSANQGYIHSYDAANDTTLLWVAVCSHSACMPLVPMKGDLRGTDLKGPWLLDPVDDTLSLVDAPPYDANLSRNVFLNDRSNVSAYSSLFEIRSPWPPFLPRLAALALVGAGLAVAATARPWGALAALGALPAFLVAKSPSFIILVQILGVPAFLISTITAIAVLLIRRRVGVAAMMVVLFALLVASGFVTFMHFPPDGGD